MTNLPEVRVRNILKDSAALVSLMDSIRGQALSIVPIYTFAVPEDYQKNESNPVVRVTPIPKEDARYADNERFLVESFVQVDFWINKKDTSGLSLMQDLIYQELHKNGYERYQPERSIDPDYPEQIMVTGLFRGRIYE
jgi:hypothetical protein